MKTYDKMNDKELDKFCDKLGLTTEDWDEGGGFIHQAVVRVVQQERARLLAAVSLLLTEYGQGDESKALTCEQFDKKYKLSPPWADDHTLVEIINRHFSKNW